MNIIMVSTLILGAYAIGMIVGYKIGFLYGKLKNFNFTTKDVDNQKSKSNTKKPEIKKSIEIDEKKFVVDITTDGMEKKYDNLGKLTKTNEDISNSVNKLKNLRKD